MLRGVGRGPARTIGSSKTPTNVMLKNLLLRTKTYEARGLKRLYLFSLPKRTKDGDSELILKCY